MSSINPKVLVIARNFPNHGLPTLGIWTERMVRASMISATPVVVAPVPWFPKIAAYGSFRQFAKIPAERLADGLQIYHPRVPVGPGMLLHPYEYRLWEPFLRHTCDKLHKKYKFDLIHAHFIYPDGILAARLGKRYDIPVVSTEQAMWKHWFAAQPKVHRLVEENLPSFSAITAVSESLANDIKSAADVDTNKLEIVYNVIDDKAFDRPDADEAWDPNQILFVGVVRHVKGLDILIEALHQLIPKYPDLRLRVVGNPYYRAYRRDEAAVRQRISDLKLDKHVNFTGQATPSEVGAAMRKSAMLVVPSRRETFSSVTAESLASGTPVVATRCGGPEEILTPATGRLVPVDNPEALAQGIEDVLLNRDSFNPAELREYALQRFGSEAIGHRIDGIYRKILSR